MKMKGKIVWLVLSCLIAVALVVASCGTAEEEDGVVEEEVVVEEEEEVVVEEEEEVVVAKGEPIYGGTLMVRKFSDPLGWDPLVTSKGYMQHLGPVRSKLITLDWFKGPSYTNEWDFDGAWVWPPADILKGDLSESWEVINTTTIIHYLRKGVMWMDKPGVMSAREFNADDVVYNYEKLMTTPGMMFNTANSRPISVTKLDDYTVEFKIREADYRMLYERIGSHFGLYAPEQYEKFGGVTDWRNITGTGPFTVTDYISGSAVIYERNPNWHFKDPEGRSLPYIDGFVVLIMEEGSTAVAALRTGQLDMMSGQSGIGWEDAESLEDTNPELLRRGKIPGSFYRILFDMTKPPFGPTMDEDALKVRQAARMAIDLNAIKDDFYKGNAILGTNTLPPHYRIEKLYIENLPAEVKKTFEYDPDGAKQLLADAGYPDGLDTTLTVVSGDTWMDLVKFYWDAVGIRTTLKVVEGGAHSSILFSHTMEGAMQSGWGLSPSIRAFGYNEEGVPDDNNTSSIIDPNINEASKAFGAEFDFEKRMDMLADIHLISVSRVYELILPTQLTYSYWQPWVQGYSGENHVNIGGPMDMYAYVWIDPSLK